MSEPFLGQICTFPYNFAPRNWAFCQGQIMSIAQNTALFSLLGVTYGGNGQTTFGLPDLRGRAPISSGQGPGLSNYAQGQVGGNESVTLTTNDMPAHTHPASVQANNEEAQSGSPDGGFPAKGGFYLPTTDGSKMNPQMVQLGPAGSNMPVETLSPYLTLNFCISLQGIYPSRN